MTRSRIYKLIVYSLVLVGVALAFYGAAGSWRGLDGIRREFIALSYLAQADAAIHNKPIRTALAVNRISRALELAGDHPTIGSRAPSILWAAGLERQALSVMRKQANPDLHLLGACLLKVGRKEDGARILRYTVKRVKKLHDQGRVSDSRYAMQLNNVGYMFADANVYLEEARPMLETAVRTLPLDPNCTDSLGWLHHRLGNDRLAAFYLQRAVRHMTGLGEPEILYHLGAVYKRMGRMREARRLLQRSLELRPGYPPAQREMKRLEWILPDVTLVNARLTHVIPTD